MESIKLMCPQALPLLPRSRIGCCPQLHWTDALSLNTTAQRHYSGLQGCTPLKRCIIQVGLGHGHIHHHMKRFNHCLWLCRMAQTIGIFPGWTGYFPREKSGKFEGKIWLAHILFRMFIHAFDFFKLKFPVYCSGTQETLKKEICFSLLQTLFLLFCHFHMKLNIN